MPVNCDNSLNTIQSGIRLVTEILKYHVNATTIIAAIDIERGGGLGSSQQERLILTPGETETSLRGNQKSETPSAAAARDAWATACTRAACVCVRITMCVFGHATISEGARTMLALLILNLERSGKYTPLPRERG